MPARNRVAVVAFDGILPFHLSIPCAVLGDTVGMGTALFDVHVCALEQGEIRTRAGFSINTPHKLNELDRADIIIVPAWRDINERPPSNLLRALVKAHQRGSIIVGLCVGVWVLAEAGLLDGHRATTHWHWAPLLANRFPKIRVDANVLYVDEGDLLTSAGSAAGIDCCLHLVRRLRGAEAANRIARMMVVPPHRQGNQAQYIEQPVSNLATDTPFAKSLVWAAAHLDETHSLDSLAARAAMSRRSFTRHFRKYTGSTVTQWLLSQRLALAQRLLETTTLPVERIAERVGFGSSFTLRQHFSSMLHTTPSLYRREFQDRDAGDNGDFEADLLLQDIQQ